MMNQHTFSLISKMISLETVVSALFLFALVMFTIMSFILYFHWTQYRVTAQVPKFIPLLYLLVGLILLALMGSIALSYIVL